MKIIQAHTARHYKHARCLLKEYADGLGIDLCFQNFEEELVSLKQIYGPPDGRLLLVYDGEESVGCVGVRGLPAAGNNACEMKRLYVRPSHRAKGVGRRLAEEILMEANRLGYDRMFLDTLNRMEKARSLYHSLGFQKTGQYYENPLEDVHFMKIDL